MRQSELFPNVSSRYGAPMGRQNITDADPELPITLHLWTMKLVDGDYDVGGAYWGCGFNGEFLCVAFAKQEGVIVVRIVLRAKNRKDAKAQVRETYPHAKFYCRKVRA